MLLMVVISLTIICIRVTRYQEKEVPQIRHFGSLKWLLIAAVSIASIREGAEIFLYASAFSDSLDSFMPVFVGGALGGGIGLSVGALVYFLLVSLPKKAWLALSLTILSLVAGGMSAQVGLNFIQIGWLPSQSPLWNTSGVLPETSLIGQLLYATLGYEASPSAIQLGFYSLPILSILFSLRLMNRGGQNKARPLDPKAQESVR